LNRRNWMPFAVVGLVALTAACDAGTPAGPEGDGTPSGSVVRRQAGTEAQQLTRFRTYEVTITNFTGGQPFTPPLVTTHEGHVGLFTVGAPASFGAKEIAENGNLAPMLGRLQSDDAFFEVQVVTGAAGPLVAGETVTFTIQAGVEARWISYMSMLICTNDGFTGVDTFSLPLEVGDTRERGTQAYETRTEINTEFFADIVPPCPALTGVPSEEPGTGMSNPGLAESGVIQMHPGILGEGNLKPSIHGFSQPVAHFSVTRTS